MKSALLDWKVSSYHGLVRHPICGQERKKGNGCLYLHSWTKTPFHYEWPDLQP